MSDKLYFKVTGGKVGEAIEKFIALRAEQLAAREAIKTEFGAKGTYGDERGLAGLVFDQAPKGWRPVRGQFEVFRPPPGKVGNEIKKRFSRLPLARARQFQAMVLGEDDMFRFMSGLSIHWMIYERIGDHTVLVVPKSNNPVVEGAGELWQPPDEHCVPIKTSEYWALKESAEALQPA